MAFQRMPDGRIPVLLSAHADDLVPVAAGDLAGYLGRFPDTTVHEVARHLLGTRRVRRHRAVVRAADRLELIDGLRALAAGREHQLVARSAVGAAARQAFVFPGQGRHWPGMGAVAYRALPGYRSAADRCAAEFEVAGVASPLGYLTATDSPRGYTEVEIQGAQFVNAVALAEVWRGCGVLPDLTVGQSLGEVAAAVIAGSITLPDAVAVVAARADLVERLPGRYAMATLGIGAAAAERLIAETDGWLELSVVYSASTVAVSGDRDAVLAVVDAVRGGGRFAREIGAGFPGHTSLLEQFREELHTRLPSARFADTPVQFIGGATGDVVAPGTPFAEYWYANLRNPVRLDRAFDAAIRCGAGSFVELSAHPALLFPLAEAFEERPEGPAALVGSARRDEPFVDALAANIVTAALADPGHAWGDHLDGCGRPGGLPDFPNAPMRAISFWARPQPLPPAPAPEVHVALEDWQPVELTAHVGGSPVRVAVIGLGGEIDLLSTFSAAVAAHPGCGPAAPADAEILVAVGPALDDDPGRAADALPGLVGAGLLGYANAGGSRCHTVCLVTVRAERVGPHDAVPSAGQAALAAMHRSLGFNHPERTFTHLDVPSRALTAAAGSAVVAALLCGAAEVALRDTAGAPVLYERAFRAASAASRPALAEGAFDNVVIAGGAGTVGLHHARYLAERGARRIVLLSRHPADPDVLRRLAAHGTRLLSPPCDITDRAGLRRLAAEYGGDGASLVVHAAGAFGAGLTADAVAETFAAKVGGLANLAELWPLRADARIVLCSSASGVWGGRGHVAYSAANRLLDVAAAGLRATGRHCVAMKWGLWQGVTGAGPGVADSAGVAQIERSGLRAMPPRAAIEASLREWHDDPLVFAADRDRLRIFLERGRSAAPRPHEADDTAVPVRDAVRAELAAVLRMDRADDLDLAESLFDLGIDSMLAVDLRRRLHRVIGRTVSLATLMGEITGAELVDKLERRTELPDRAEKVDLARD
ncbi:mycobactin polyketide synthase MbtD [Mycobacterium sp. Marseille-P9652]|uniref:mycobactin polyketide synthase MbtD n=1 Tax=Mycobacterium sp. Marseille-P9652 TaxID=2654950 RepID=UPI0012E8CCB6|nr:mycobactin polyketide synthase MbtD [Mycobacterium sp. Marseille-P9652]